MHGHWGGLASGGSVAVVGRARLGIQLKAGAGSITDRLGKGVREPKDNVLASAWAFE